MKKSSEKYLNPVLPSLVWHRKKLTHFIIMLVVPLQIQAINPLIFRAQRLNVFLGVYLSFINSTNS